MSRYAVIWDLETVPDLAAFKRMCGTPDITNEEAEAVLGDKFATPDLLLLPEARHHLVNESEELRRRYLDFLRERLG